MAKDKMFDRISKGLYWDRIWKLVDGCTPISDGCLHCWSARYTHRFDGEFKGSCDHQFTNDDQKFTGNIKLHHDHLDLPLRTQKPQAWLILNDLFHPDVPNEFLHKAFSIMISERRHIFLVLTKRIKRMGDFLLHGGVHGWQTPRENIWLGVTVCNQEEADEKIPLLLQIPTAVRWLSIEPMLGPIKFPKIQVGKRHLRSGKSEPLNVSSLGSTTLCGEDLYDFEGISWVICGGESGPGARPMQIEWARSIIQQCEVAGVKCFVKQIHNSLHNAMRARKEDKDGSFSV